MKIGNVQRKTLFQNLGLPLLLSSWAPILWIVLIPGHDINVLKSWGHFNGYVLYPVLSLWFGAFPLSLAFVLTYRKISWWFLLSATIAIFICLCSFFFAIAVESPDGGFFGKGGTGPIKFARVMGIVGGVMVLTSILVWMQLGLWMASQARRG